MNVIKNYKRITASTEDSVIEIDSLGDIVCACNVCGRLAIADDGEDLELTACIDCGNTDWQILPFKKDVQDIGYGRDREDIAAGIRRKRVGAAWYTNGSALARAKRCQQYAKAMLEDIEQEKYEEAQKAAGQLSNTADFLYDELYELKGQK